MILPQKMDFLLLRKFIGWLLYWKTTTSFGNINLGLSGASSSLPACRTYYFQIQVEPQKAKKKKALTYIENNRNKKVVYKTFLSNQYNNITGSGTFDQLINSGVVHPVGILIIPYISSTTAGLVNFRWKSPFDSCTATSAPLSLKRRSQCQYFFPK